MSLMNISNSKPHTPLHTMPTVWMMDEVMVALTSVNRSGEMLEEKGSYIGDNGFDKGDSERRGQSVKEDDGCYGGSDSSRSFLLNLQNNGAERDLVNISATCSIVGLRRDAQRRDYRRTPSVVVGTVVGALSEDSGATEPQ
ncbi:hypothetical protein PIB30_063765 [Stylosanthes scabra]|uniref:Uncharacterized protein n=1 Tax=Stylosanthes scabra TaxID=79078 RepID=A0ABU6UP00_9FABA|nr:hypothetical protein [Stylosanthes scabra]